MDSEEYRNFLLSSIPSAKIVSGGKEINCRCMECMDSNNPKSRHMYISIPDFSNEPSLYNCFKCGCKGIVTHKTLIDWGIYDINIASELSELNKRLSKSERYKGYYEKEVYRLNNTLVTRDKLSEYKLKYINKRLGLSLTYEDLMRLKIILNISDLLECNNIRTYTRNINIVKDLDRYFMGFISIDNAFVNMRRVIDSKDIINSINKRYINYEVFNKVFSAKERFYTIPTAVNLETPNRIKLHVAEGPFDILSIYLNCRKGEEGIYTSVCGNRYNTVINYFISTYKLPNLEVHLYPDNDKYGTDDYLRNMMSYCLDPFIPVFVHRNIEPGEKDFGVSADKIKEQIHQLK